MSNFEGSTRTDAEGRFTFDGLEDGTINFYIQAKVVSDKVKAALVEVIKKKAAQGQLVVKTYDGAISLPLEGRVLRLYPLRASP